MSPSTIEGCVRRHFDFLKDEHGFVDWPDGVGYANADLRFEFYWGKGELDVIVQVTRDDEIFRPYVSRQFYLGSVAEGLKKGRIEYPSDWPRWVTNLSQVDRLLSFYAVLTKKYCKPLLNGDLSHLEEIHLKRREEAKRRS